MAEIIGRGNTAVVVFRMDDADPLVRVAVRALGWDGVSSVFVFHPVQGDDVEPRSLDERRPMGG